MEQHTKKTCWIVVEAGLTGTVNQCIGVSLALGIKPKIIKDIKMKWPWSLVTPHVELTNPEIYEPDFIKAPFPDILIAAGRKSIAASLMIKKMSGGKTFTVQLQDPKIDPKNFDLVAAPFHDEIRGENVILTDGAPNRITQRRIDRARNHFAPLFEPLKTPRMAVLIGGNSKTHSLTRRHVENLIETLTPIDASFMVTASRRTDAINIDLLRQAFDTPGHYFWDGKSANPYLGMLAWADHILVTEDSVSMISDAGSTGKPVHIIDMAGGSARFDRFKDHMHDLGVTRAFDGNLEHWSYEPLTDAQKVADEIAKRIK